MFAPLRSRFYVFSATTMFCMCEAEKQKKRLEALTRVGLCSETENDEK